MKKPPEFFFEWFFYILIKFGGIMKKSNKFLLLIAIICLSISFVACNSNAHNDGTSSPEIGDEAPSQGFDFITVTEARKLVYTVVLDITVLDMAKSGGEIVEKARSYGGWVENSNESTNGDRIVGYYVLRVPTEKLDEFLVEAEGKGEVSNKNVSSEDITTVYVTATARKDALEQEKADLNSLTLNTTAEIFLRSERIGQINAELGALELQINNYDSIVSYSKVTVTLSNVPQEKDKIPFGEKIGNVFRGSLRSVVVVFSSLFIAFVAAFPYIVIFAVIAAAVIGIRFLIKKRFPTMKKTKNKVINNVDLNDLNDLNDKE